MLEELKQEIGYNNVNIQKILINHFKNLSLDSLNKSTFNTYDHNFRSCLIYKNVILNKELQFTIAIADCHDIVTNGNINDVKFYSNGYQISDCTSILMMFNKTALTANKSVEDFVETYNNFMQQISHYNNVDFGKLYLMEENDNSVCFGFVINHEALLNKLKECYPNEDKRSITTVNVFYRSIYYMIMKLGRVVLFSGEEKVDLYKAIDNYITKRGIYSKDIYVMSSLGVKEVQTLFLNFIPYFLEKSAFNQFYASVNPSSLRAWMKGKEFPIITPSSQIEKEQKQMTIKAKYLRKKLAPLIVYSRHPSHDELRELHISVRALIRLGSTTDKPSKFPRLEINSVGAVQNSASKIRMKNAFQKAGVITAPWCVPNNIEELNTFFSTFEKDCKFVTKSQFGSRGEGNQLHETAEAVRNFFTRNRYGNYVVEKFMTHSKEYRLHVDKYGNCFYACRKVHVKDTPDNQRWFRNDKNCNWIIETNPLFEKPATWDLIIKECVKALNAVGLHVGAVDVKVNKKGEFFILETNSAPSFGDITLQKYQEQIPVILNNMLQEEASLTKN